jgi:hypothetical protein
MGVGLVSTLFICSVCAQSLWCLADRKGRRSVLAHVRLVGVGLVTVGRADREGRWSDLASFPLVGVGSVTVVAGR